jgi:MinD-like ATPase involved in chromosome partitioning or flagellar assembly
MTQIVAIAGGETEVGKSTLAPNLSWHLTQGGYRTGLVVAGGRQPVWGIEPDSQWPDVLEGRLPLDQVVHRDVFGIDLVVAGNSSHTLQELCSRNGSDWHNALGPLEDYAYLIVDCAAQTSPSSLACCLAATTTLLVLTPDTNRLTAIYGWLSHLARHDLKGPIRIVLNQVDNPNQARSIYLRFRDQVRNRLGLQTSFWGSLSKENGTNPRDLELLPLSQTMARSGLLRNIHAIGDRLVTEHPPDSPAGSVQAFWKRFRDYLRQVPAEPSILQRKPPAAPEDRTPMKDLRQPATGNAQALAWLNTQLTSIAHDLQAIRRLLEAGPGPKPAPLHGETLDFEAYISRNQKPEEK